MSRNHFQLPRAWAYIFRILWGMLQRVQATVAKKQTNNCPEYGATAVAVAASS